MLPVVYTVALLAFTAPHAVLRVRSSRSASAAMSIERPRPRTGGGVPRPLRFQPRDRSMPSWFNMGAQEADQGRGQDAKHPYYAPPAGRPACRAPTRRPPHAAARVRAAAPAA